MKLHLASRNGVPEAWAKHRDALLKALARTDNFNEADVLQMLLAGHMQLWHCDTAACVGQVITYPKLKVYSFPLVAGVGRDEWLHFQDDIAKWAKQHGCSQFEGYARRGWLRVLTDWTEKHTVIRKDI